MPDLNQYSYPVSISGDDSAGRQKARRIEILQSLIVANNFYNREGCTEQERGRILSAFEPVAEELEALTGDRRSKSFVTLCILYGDEFIRAESKFNTLDDYIKSL